MNKLTYLSYRFLFGSLIFVLASINVNAMTVNEAYKEFEKRNYASAVPVLKSYARKGNLKSIQWLSYYYQEIKKPNDIRQLAEIYRLDIKFSTGNRQGQAQHNLALLYLTGKLPDENGKLGTDLLKKAAKNNVPISKFLLAKAYLYGHGVKQDKKQAFYWLKQVSKMNLAEAQYYLAVFYFQEADVVKKDIEKAFNHIYNAYEKSSAKEWFGIKARLMLGEMYIKGIHALKDVKRGVGIIESAGKEGYARLVDLYYDGKDTEKDLKKSYLYTYKLSFMDKENSAKINTVLNKLRDEMKPSKLKETYCDLGFKHLHGYSDLDKDRSKSEHFYNLASGECPILAGLFGEPKCEDLTNLISAANNHFVKLRDKKRNYNRQGFKYSTYRIKKVIRVPGNFSGVKCDYTEFPSKNVFNCTYTVEGRDLGIAKRTHRNLKSFVEQCVSYNRRNVKLNQKTKLISIFNYDITTYDLSNKKLILNLYKSLGSKFIDLKIETK